MATRIIASGDAHPIPSQGGPQRSIDANLIANAVDELASLNNLLRWIGRARDFIAGIETGRQLSPEFAAQLKLRDFDHLDAPASVSVTVDSSINVHDGLITTVTSVGLAPKHTPDFETFRTVVASITYTPSQNVTGTITISGSGAVTTSSWSAGSGPSILGGIYIQGTFPSGSTPVDCMHATVPIGPGATGYLTVSGSRSFSLTAGTTYVFEFLSVISGFAGDTATVTNMEMRLDVNKGV